MSEGAPAIEMSLFVYGSLTQGMVHYGLIEKYVTSSTPASIKGFAYRLQVGYPIVLQPEDNDKADWVSGTALKLQAPDMVYKLLDEFHGYSPLFPEKSLFFKANVSCKTDCGNITDSQTYFMNPAKLPKAAVYLSGGDWRNSLQAQPVMTGQLTERQSGYIKRLSQSSGREIIPIDLELYRELMKLDLIVDKGRRLALTKFGKEVARYL